MDGLIRVLTIKGEDTTLVAEEYIHSLCAGPVCISSITLLSETQKLWMGATQHVVKVGNHSVEVVGKPHASAGHKITTINKVMDLVRSGKYTKIFLNKSLKTAGLNGLW